MSQALEKTVGRGSMGGGFLDFCGRKKPPVGGRAERGRGVGAGRGEGQEVGENCLLQAEGEGRAGRRAGTVFVWFVPQGPSPVNGLSAHKAVSCPRGNSWHLGTKMQCALAASLFSIRALRR